MMFGFAILGRPSTYSILELSRGRTYSILILSRDIEEHDALAKENPII